MALTLHFGNVVYLYLTVSFIQMLKAFTPVVTMGKEEKRRRRRVWSKERKREEVERKLTLFRKMKNQKKKKHFSPAALFAAGLEKPRRDLVGAVAAIAGGTALASAGEVDLSLVGVGCMAASEGFEAARLVLTQTLLAAGGPRSLGPIEGLLYLAPACSAWLLAGSAVLELPAMRRDGAMEVVMVRGRFILFLTFFLSSFVSQKLTPLFSFLLPPKLQSNTPPQRCSNAPSSSWPRQPWASPATRWRTE